LERDLSHAGSGPCRQAIAHLQLWAEMASELALPFVVVVASDSAAELTGAERSAALGRVASSIDTAMAGAGEAGPWLALDPLNRNETSLVRTLAEADDLRATGHIPLPGDNICPEVDCPRVPPCHSAQRAELAANLLGWTVPSEKRPS
jgi:hypothetical protein